ncbi:MAG: hypothetical protein DMG34_04315 [Acidobacteria bacterium]|nr:MAG: hypothetical protein DMG34_04315 [Acidobacteriota bacterium]
MEQVQECPYRDRQANTDLSNLISISFRAIRFLAKRSPDPQSTALAKGIWKQEIRSFVSGVEGKN